MQVIFVADIFGISYEFEQLCQQTMLALSQRLSTKQSAGLSYLLIGPYQERKRFANEQEAYHYFSENVGLERYTQQLKQRLAALSGQKLLVGFSVGGSAIWQLSSTHVDLKNLAAICFYSSQIRHFCELSPNIASYMIMPATEQHFSITDLQTKLATKANVSVERSQYQHGFMNHLSSHFDLNGYHEYSEKLLSLLAAKIQGKQWPLSR
ncbi:Dienelactone hydrolase [Colwellia chukchiensis]|uniref:Dienelactone hydrolase n=1 Tax=Colwellia chukchiensis TaxID=641665 RepID=A0A1H7JEW5_9GAMM|nr:dienelactone hydrolase family protein [Colwellia chukchiensis]SEK71935.1 Dienelactone hydrolase [Colwellia chukchiensis]